MASPPSVDFAAALRTRGLRPTPQRRAVWSVFEAEPAAHLSADEVLKRARATLPEIARGTVYNALGDLVEAGMLGTIQLGGSQLYDANAEPHQHFRCSRCDRLYDVRARGLDRLDVGHAGFAVERAQVLFEGTCASCA